MAKNFPYFKFVVTEWLTGDIVYEDYCVQGLFINICALYWQRDGKLTIDDINKRYKSPKELKELTDRFFSVNDGFIRIKFLDEQLIDANHISMVNSANGSLGGRPKKTDRLPTDNRPQSELKAKKSKEEEEEEEEEEEKKINQFPTFESFSIDLADADIKNCIEVYKLRKYVLLSTNQVQDMFKAFKLQNLTGKKFYEKDEDVISHFKNWLPFQKIENSKPEPPKEPSREELLRHAQALADRYS